MLLVGGANLEFSGVQLNRERAAGTWYDPAILYIFEFILIALVYKSCFET